MRSCAHDPNRTHRQPARRDRAARRRARRDRAALEPRRERRRPRRDRRHVPDHGDGGHGRLPSAPHPPRVRHASVARADHCGARLARGAVLGARLGRAGPGSRSRRLARQPHSVRPTAAHVAALPWGSNRGPRRRIRRDRRAAHRVCDTSSRQASDLSRSPRCAQGLRQIHPPDGRIGRTPPSEPGTWVGRGPGSVARPFIADGAAPAERRPSARPATRRRRAPAPRGGSAHGPLRAHRTPRRAPAAAPPGAGRASGCPPAASRGRCLVVSPYIRAHREVWLRVPGKDAGTNGEAAGPTVCLWHIECPSTPPGAARGCLDCTRTGQTGR